MDVNTMIPIVVEQTPHGERSYDIYSRLMKERIVMLCEPVSSFSSNRIVASLLYLDSERNRDISFYINSPGGTVTDGLAIYDTMKSLRSSVSTICIGQACSMGAFLLAGGTKGRRFSLPNSRIMIHQVSSGTEGTYKDMYVSLKETERLNDSLAEILAGNTGQDLEKIKHDIDRDFFMSSNEARAYGLIDEIIEKIPYEQENKD